MYNHPEFEYHNIDSDLIVKWNASLHWTAKNDFRISAYVYDILAEPTGSNATHSIRWQQSSDAENQMDRKGRPMFRCVVCFEGENQGYFRTISEKAREQV